MSENKFYSRQERRDKKLKKKRGHMPKHGKNLARIYLESIRKRLKRRRKPED